MTRIASALEWRPKPHPDPFKPASMVPFTADEVTLQSSDGFSPTGLTTVLLSRFLSKIALLHVSGRRPTRRPTSRHVLPSCRSVSALVTRSSVTSLGLPGRLPGRFRAYRRFQPPPASERTRSKRTHSLARNSSSATDILRGADEMSALSGSWCGLSPSAHWRTGLISTSGGAFEGSEPPDATSTLRSCPRADRGGADVGRGRRPGLIVGLLAAIGAN